MKCSFDQKFGVVIHRFDKNCRICECGGVVVEECAQKVGWGRKRAVFADEQRKGLSFVEERADARSEGDFGGEEV